MGFNVKSLYKNDVENTSSVKKQKGFNVKSLRDQEFQLNNVNNQYIGNVSYDAKKAIEGDTLGSYEPKNKEEKKVLDAYVEQILHSTLSDAEKEVFKRYDIKTINFDYNDLGKWASQHNYAVKNSSSGVRYEPKYSDGFFGIGAKKLSSEQEDKDFKVLEKLASENTYKKAAKESPVIMSAVTVAAAPLRGVAGAVSTAEEFAEAVTGKDFNLDAGRMAKATDIVRGTVTDEYASKWFGGKEGKLGNYGSLVYNGLMSIGDNVVNTLTVGKFTGGLGLSKEKASKVASNFVSGLMASDSAASNIVKNKERGLSDAKAVGLGIAAGLTEFATEKFSLEQIFKEPTTIMKGVFKSFFSEGSEEMASEVINTVVDTLVSGEDSEIRKQIKKYEQAGLNRSEAVKKTIEDKFYQTLSSGLVGGLSGVAMGGAYSGINASDEAKMGKQFKDVAFDVINTGLDSPSDSEAYQNALRLLEKNSLSNRDIGKQYRLNVEQIEQEENVKSKLNKESIADKPKHYDLPKQVETDIYSNTITSAANAFKSELEEIASSGAVELFAPENASESVKLLEKELIRSGIADEQRKVIIDSAVNTENRSKAPDMVQAERAENKNDKSRASITVGDSFKDTKTGNTITVIERGAESTIVQIDTGKKTEIKEFTNEQADTLAENIQYEPIEKSKKLSPKEAQNYNIVVSNLKRKAEELGLLDNNFFATLQNVNLYNPTASDRALISSEFRRVFAGNTDTLVANWLNAINVDTQPVTSINEKNVHVSKENTSDSDTAANAEVINHTKEIEGLKLIDTEKSTLVNGKTLITGVYELNSDKDFGRGSYKKEQFNIFSQVEPWTAAVSGTTYGHYGFAKRKSGGYVVTYLPVGLGVTKANTEKEAKLLLKTLEENRPELPLSIKAFGDGYRCLGIRRELVTDIKEVIDTAVNSDKTTNTEIQEGKVPFNTKAGLIEYVKAHKGDNVRVTFDNGISEVRTLEGVSNTNLRTKKPDGSVSNAELKGLKFNDEGFSVDYSTGVSASYDFVNVGETDDNATKSDESVTGAKYEHLYNEEKVSKAYIDSVNPEIENAIISIRNGDIDNIPDVINVTKLDEKTIKAISDFVGYDVSGYVCKIERDRLVHIENRHGINGEHDQSLSDPKDFARMGYVVNNSDSIDWVVDGKGNRVFDKQYNDKNNKPSPVIMLNSKIDGTYCISQAVPDSKKKTLWITSARIQKAAVGSQVPYDSNATPQLQTSETPLNSSSASDDIVSQDADTVNKESKVYDVAYFEKLGSDIRKGESVSLKGVKTAVDAILLNHGEAIKAELSQLKNDELKKRISIYDRGRITKKAEMVDSIYTDMLSSLYYALSGKETITYIYDGTGFDAQQSKMLFDISRELTEETFNKRLAENAEKYKKQVAAREEKLSKVKNPQTLEDYAYKKRYFGLSDEETIQYENLYAEERRKAREEKKAAKTTKDTSDADAFFANADNYTIEITTHTKTGEDVWVVRPTNRLETEQWKQLNEQMKALGGSYWRGNQGWNFKKDPTAALTSTEEAETVKGSTNAEKLRAVAEGMQKAIDDKFRDRLTNTAKRAREAASAEAEGERLKRLQDTINNIADALENGENTLLDKIDSKAQVETLMSMLRTGRRNRISETLPDITYDERLQEQDKPYSNDDAKYAEYPLTKLHESAITEYIRAAEGETGYKQITDRLKKSLKSVKNGYVTVDEQMFADIDKIVQNLSTYRADFWNDGVAERKRLARMGIENVVELRAYLREFIKFLPGKDADAERQRNIKAKERQLANAKIEGFFPTPKAIVEKMLDEADIKSGEKVLEPSAGKGNIADAIRENYPDNALDVVEWNASLNELLSEKGHNVVGSDFLQHSGEYDKIIMNPPFEKGQDIDHIRHAYSLLNDGGRVVCIMSEGPFFRSDKKATEFREWLDSLGGVSEKLPEGAFKSSERSTGVNTRIVVVDKASDNSIQQKKDAVLSAIRHTIHPEILANDELMGRLSDKFGDTGIDGVADTLIALYGKDGAIGDFEKLFTDGGKEIYGALQKRYGENSKYSISERGVILNEQTGNDLLSENSERRNDESDGKQAERISKYQQRLKGKTEAERKAVAEELRQKNLTEEVTDGKHKYQLVKLEGYNDDMRSIVEDAKKKGKKVGFFIDHAKRRFDSQNDFLIDGIMISDTEILLRYDGEYPPQTLLVHEDVHTEWDAQEMQKVKDIILNDLPDAEKKKILSEERYKNYLKLYKGDVNAVWEEFIADVFAGMNSYTYNYIDTVVGYLYDGKAIDRYNPAEYNKLIDTGNPNESVLESVEVGNNYRLSESGELDGYGKDDTRKELGRISNIRSDKTSAGVDKVGHLQPKTSDTPHTKSVHRSGVSAEVVTSSGLTAEQAQLKAQNKVEGFDTEYFVKARTESGSFDGIFNTENTAYYPDRAFERNGIVIKDGVASFTPKRFEDLIEEFSVPVGGQLNQNYAKGYVAYISPSDFLSLTTNNEKGIIEQTQTMPSVYGSGKLDVNQLAATRQTPYLEIDFDNGTVYGHEGRHRMVMLRDAGVDKVAIVVKSLNPEAGKYRTEKMQNVFITGQVMNGKKTPGKVTLDEIIPLSPAYRDEVAEKFVKKPTDIKYALSGSDNDADFWKEWFAKAEEYGVIPKGEKPVRDVNVPQKISDRKIVSRFARTLLEAGITPDESTSDFEKAILDGEMTHEVITDKKAKTKAEDRIKREGFKETLRDWDGIAKDGKLSKEHFVLGMELYNQCITNKDIHNAMKLAAELAAEATRAGQTLQSVRMLKKMTPDGQLYYLEKSIQKMNEEFKEKLGDKYKDIELDESLMKDFLTGKDEAERNAAYDKLCQNIADQMPTTLRDKWDSWRYLAMLGNPRTHIRNILGNAVFILPLKFKNFVGAVIENVAKVDTKERTKSVLKSKEAVEFAKNDFSKMQKALQGENAKYAVTNDIEGKRTIFKTKWLEKLRTANFKWLEIEDMWFLKYHYVDALAQIITVRNLDVNNIDEKVLDTARAYAVREAQRATYRDANALAEALNKLQKKAEYSDKKAIQATGILLEGVMPFKKTPLNIAKQGVQYSPVGILSGVYKTVSKIKDGDAFSTADVIDDFAKALSGTALMILGTFLASLGFISGNDDENEKKKEFDKMVGEQSFSLNIGNSSYTIDWMTPACLPLFTGAELYKLTKDEFKFADIANALSSLTDPLLELSVFSGVSDAIEAARFNQTNTFFAIVSDITTSFLTQALPTIGGQISRIIDKNKREYYYMDKNINLPYGVQSFLGQVSSKIPFASYLFEPSIDEWGREETYGSIIERTLENAVSPGYYSEKNYTRVDEEIKRLYESTGNTDVLPVVQQKKYTADYVDYPMTAAQYTKVKRLRGQESFKSISQLIKDKTIVKLRKKDGTYHKKLYSQMTDAEKVRAIKRCYDDAEDYAKEIMLEEVKNNR